VGLYRVALVAAGISGCGFALFYPPLLALIQRVVSEEQRGRVTGLFVALQETMGLVSSLALLALAPLIVVRPTMVGSSMVLVTIGLLGVRAARRQETTEHDDVAASR
jgi:MFS family permease